MMSLPDSVPRRALIVDDDEGNRLTLAALLEQAGYDVVEAACVVEGRRALAGHAYRLAIIDLALREGSGLDLLPDLKSQQPQAKVVLYTGSAPASLPPGVDLVILKGSEPLEVLRKLETVTRTAL